MKTEYYTNRWLLALDMVGMVLAPISFTIPLFFMAIQRLQTTSSNGISNTLANVLFFGALVILILLGSYFGWFLKSYVKHQVTRDEVKIIRVVYIGLILGSLVVDFMIYYGFFLGP